MSARARSTSHGVSTVTHLLQALALYAVATRLARGNLSRQAVALVSATMLAASLPSAVVALAPMLCAGMGIEAACRHADGGGAGIVRAFCSTNSSHGVGVTDDHSSKPTQPTHPRDEEGRSPTILHIDSMALKFIFQSSEALVRITIRNPLATIETVSGSIPVDYIGVAGINVEASNGDWYYFEIPDAFVSEHSTVDLYSVRMAHSTLGLRHRFDGDNVLLLPDGAQVVFGSTPDGYPLRTILGKRLQHATVIPPLPAAAAAMAAGEGRASEPYQGLWPVSPTLGGASPF